MQKTIVKIEVKTGDRVYQFLCDSDSPLGEVHDALFQMKAHIIDMMNEADKKKEEKPADPSA